MHLDLETIKLGRGKHSQSSGQACVMECVACLAGEEFTDMPKCVSPVIGAFMRSWNDAMDDDTRQILKPLIPVIMNTATGGADEITRSWMAQDWMIRTFTADWLELAGLKSHAEGLRGLAPITNGESLASAMGALIEARQASAAAWDAAWDAARAAAWDAARAAAWDAAWDAARDAAWDAEKSWQTSRLMEYLDLEVSTEGTAS